MTKLKEIWKNRKQILEGITNSVIRDEFVEKVAAERIKICNACVRKDTEGSTCLAPGTQPCCNLCGCSLHFKVRSLSTHCPDHKWDKVLTEKEEDKLNELP